MRTGYGSNISGQGRRFWAPSPAEPGLNSVGKTNGNDTGGRFRQFFKFNWPFAFHPAASLVSWDEVFVHLNSTDWGARQGFDQNRGFVGIGYRFNPIS